MPPKATIFSKEKESQLIDEVERRPFLWDASSHRYRRVDLKPMAWDAIACALGSPFTSDMVAKRFKNMKETFAKNLNKVRASKEKSSGDGYDDSFKPTWYLYDRLKFLEKICAQSRPEYNLTSATNTLQPSLSPELTQSEHDEHSGIHMYYDATLQKYHLITPDIGMTCSEGTESDLEVQTVMTSSTASEDLGSIFSNPNSPMRPLLLRPASAPIDGTRCEKRPNEENEFFNKRGASKKAQATRVLEKAVSVMQDLANQPAPTINVEAKPWDGICSFIGARLSILSDDTRKACENELLQVLMKY